MAAFERLELGHALLQLRQLIGVALEPGAVAIEVAGEILQARQGIGAGLAHRLQGGIQNLHLLEFLFTGRQMVEGRGRLFGPLHQPAQQEAHPLLQPNAVGQPVLLDLQPLPLLRVVEGGCLQVVEELKLLLPFALEPLLVGQGGGQGCLRRTPAAEAEAARLQQAQLAVAGKPVEPAALLAGTGQLLGLALHGEIEQQGAQFEDLGAAHRGAVDPVAAVGASLLEPPVAAEQQLVAVGLEVLLLEPGPHRGAEGEAGFDAAPFAAAAQQAGPLGALGAAEQGIEGIEEDRLAGAGLAGEHTEAGPERELEAFDQGDVLEAQSGEHPRLRESFGQPPDRSGCVFRLEGEPPGSTPRWCPLQPRPPCPPCARPCREQPCRLFRSQKRHRRP